MIVHPRCPRLSVSLLLALAPALQAQESTAGETITWITTQLDTEISREVFTLTEDGWRSEIAVDVPGKKVDFAVELVRGEPLDHWKLELLPRSDDSVVIKATREGKQVAVEIQPGGRERAFEIDGPAPFFFENLVNGCLYELSRDLLARAAAGELAEGDLSTAILAQAGTSLPFTFTGRELLSAEGEPNLWKLSIQFSAGIDMWWVCADDGLPRHIEVPAQKVAVTREGADYRPELTAADTVPGVDSGPWVTDLSAPEYQVQVDRDLAVPMSDGVELVVDVHRPEAEGRYPTILVRTPYDRHGEGLIKGARFAKRGYAVVVQDVRGRFASGGEFSPLIQEVQDGSDTIDWIAAQDWSDGKVGMIGASYVGWVQWYAAKSCNPHLKAIIPQVSPPDPDQNIPYEGGVFLLGTAWWSKVMSRMAAGKAGLPDMKWQKVLATLPLGDLDEALGSDMPFLDEWLAHPPDDGAYWNPRRYQTSLEDMDVAAMHITGWFDGDQPGAMQNFPALRARGKNQRVRDGQSLIVGAWGHAFNLFHELGEVDFGPDAVIDMQARELRFFDRYLKGIENGIENEKPVWVFVMGENRWHNEAAWPLPGTLTTNLYLASDGDATVRGGDGRAALEPAAGTRSNSSVLYDPRDLPKDVFDWDDTTGKAATMDLEQLEDRADILDFTSPPLASPVELTGNFEAKLWVRSSAEDADYAVSLNRITPDGVMRRIAGGIQRVRYRSGRDEPVAPGQVALITVDCWASSIRLEAGDRLRVEVACSGFPGFARNLGTLDPLSSGTNIVVATNTVLHDRDHPSHVLLPVVPREGAPGLSFVQEEQD
jgi:uncharacterized protein